MITDVINEVVRKHIDIKSSIRTNNLETKLRTINNFHAKRLRSDVLVKRLRCTTSLDVYNLFFNILQHG